MHTQLKGQAHSLSFSSCFSSLKGILVLLLFAAGVLTVFPLSASEGSWEWGGQGSFVLIYLTDATICCSVKLVRHGAGFCSTSQPRGQMVCKLQGARQRRRHLLGTWPVCSQISRDACSTCPLQTFHSLLGAERVHAASKGLQSLLRT